MKNNINIKPMPGFMELLPNEQIVFNNMLKTIRETYESFGFRSIETPLIERAEVLLTKGSGETDKQIYQFKKGDNDLALRFDLTVPLARYVANNQNDLVFPFKVCNIGKVYRGEKPQAGRFREFYQCDIDIIDRDDLDLSFDAELVKAVTTLFKNLSFNNFIMKLNNRKIMNGFFDSLEIDDPTEVLRSIDKLEKQGEESVKEELKCSGLTDETISKIFDFVGITGDIIPQLKELKIKNAMFKKGLEELEQLEKQIKMLGVDDDKWTIDLTIARGLDYYTGTVYETFLTDYPEFGSVCSGGRYDDLASYYTNTKLPGVGCSIGLTRLFDCLLRNDLLDVSKSSPTDVLIIGMENYESNAASLGDVLRNKGLNVEVRFGIKGGFKYADKLGIPYVIIIGEEEIEKDVYTLKDMKSGEQMSLDLENLFSKLGV
jgi:histidyl-tRNA synthetase